MVGAGAHGEVDPWRGGGGRGRWRGERPRWDVGAAAAAGGGAAATGGGVPRDGLAFDRLKHQHHDFQTLPTL